MGGRGGRLFMRLTFGRRCTFIFARFYVRYSVVHFKLWRFLIGDVEELSLVCLHEDWYRGWCSFFSKVSLLKMFVRWKFVITRARLKCSLRSFKKIKIKEMDFYCSEWKFIGGMFVQSFHSIIHFSCRVLVYFSVSIILWHEKVFFWKKNCSRKKCRNILYTKKYYAAAARDIFVRRKRYSI